MILKMTSERKVAFPRRVLERLGWREGDCPQLSETTGGIRITPHFAAELYEGQRECIRTVDKPALEQNATEVLPPDFVSMVGAWWDPVLAADE
jgi:hypothetical protein